MRQPSKVGSRSASDLSTPYPMQLRQTRTYRYEYESHVTASRTDETVPSDTWDPIAEIFAEARDKRRGGGVAAYLGIEVVAQMRRQVRLYRLLKSEHLRSSDTRWEHEKGGLENSPREFAEAHAPAGSGRASRAW